MEMRPHELNDYEPSDRELAADEWKWKRVRNISIGIEFWPLEWGFGIDRNADFYGGKTSLGLGPFVIYIQYNACTGIFGRAEWRVPV